MILGHDAQSAELRAAIDSERMHHAWLLHGPKGVGKAAFAKTFAASILAEASDNSLASGIDLPDGHPTARLIAARSHSDFVLVEREVWVPSASPPRLVPYGDRKGDEALGRNIRVVQIRWLEPILNMSPSMSSKRVVIIDAADDLETGAANALLKMLEEPPASTIFLLISHAPGRLLPTIRSRCRSLAFGRLDDDAMTSFLLHHAPDLDTITRAVIITLADGSPGTALGVIEADVPGIDATLREIAADGDGNAAMRLELATKLAGKAALSRYEAFLRRAPAFIAARARSAEGERLAHVVEHWEAARGLADVAIAASLPVESVVFDIASHIAALAAEPARAKA